MQLDPAWDMSLSDTLRRRSARPRSKGISAVGNGRMQRTSGSTDQDTPEPAAIVYQATFSDGTVVDSRAYRPGALGSTKYTAILTHAWIVKVIRPNKSEFQEHGFAIGEKQAYGTKRQLLKHIPSKYRIDLDEIVLAVQKEISVS